MASRPAHRTGPTTSQTTFLHSRAFPSQTNPSVRDSSIGRAQHAVESICLIQSASASLITIFSLAWILCIEDKYVRIPANTYALPMMTKYSFNTCWANIFKQDGSDTLKQTASIQPQTILSCFRIIKPSFATENVPANGLATSCPPLLTLATMFFIPSRHLLIHPHSNIPSTVISPCHQNTCVSQYPVHLLHCLSPPLMCRLDLRVPLIVQVTQHSFPRCGLPPEGHSILAHILMLRLFRSRFLLVRARSPSAGQRNLLHLKHSTCPTVPLLQTCSPLSCTISSSSDHFNSVRYHCLDFSPG